MKQFCFALLALTAGVFAVPGAVLAQGGPGGDVCGHCLEDPWPSPGGHAIVSSDPGIFTHQPTHTWVTGISCDDHDEECKPILSPGPDFTPEDQINLLAMAHNAFLLDEKGLDTLTRHLRAFQTPETGMLAFQPCQNGPWIEVPVSVRPR